MYKKVTDITQVEGFTFKTNNYIQKNGNLYLFNKDKLSKLIDDVYVFTIDERFIYYQTENLGSLLRWSIERQTIDRIDGSFSLKGAYLFSKSLIYILGKKNEEKVIYLIDKINFKIQNIIPYTKFPEIELQNGVLQQKRNNLTYRNLIDDKIIWTFEPPNKQEITKKLHLHDNILIVPTKGNRLYGIDAESGEQLWELEGTHPSYVKHPQTGLLYAHGSNVYQIVDPGKGEIVFEKDFTEENKQYGILPAPSGHICGNGIYFISNTGGSKFGKVNIETHTLEFVQKLDVEEGVTAQHPVYHQGRIYILDNSGKLHIYEKS